MKIAVVSARRDPGAVPQQCAQDFETAIVNSTGADLLAPLQNTQQRHTNADLVVFAALNFRDLEDIILATQVSDAAKVVGYVFGAYPQAFLPVRNPISKWRNTQRLKAYKKLDKLFIGVEVGAEEISKAVDMPAIYLPMAADVLRVAATPFGPDAERPIAVSAFGRQHLPTKTAIADRLNQSDSRDVLYATNFMRTNGAHDVTRYRAMFWQMLRLSRLSLAFDQVMAPNPGGAHLSYVGPRWFESLAAGTVVAGWAPRGDDVPVLLDWEDSTIELPQNPEESADFVMELLSDPTRLQKASARNLHHMNKRHDWRHRLKVILDELNLQHPDALSAQLKTLSERADRLPM